MRLSILGLVSVIAGAISVAPAFAGTPASISGSTTFVTPAGFTSTVSGESILPTGLAFSTLAAVITVPAVPNVNVGLTNPAVIVVPSYNVLGFSVATTSLQVASSAAAVATTVPTSFSAAAAQVLTDAAAAGDPTATGAELRRGPGAGVRVYNSSNIDFISAIIKSGAGVNGLD